MRLDKQFALLFWNSYF